MNGDADRCLAVDENGNVIDGDLILYVCGKYLKEIGQLKDDMIVTTVMSNIWSVQGMRQSWTSLPADQGRR